MRITFRVDASPLMGGGHAMRCLALADALALQGASIRFVSATMPNAIAKRIVDAGHQLVGIAVAGEPPSSAADWHEHVLDNETQSADFDATQRAGLGDWIVVDHYLLDRRWHSDARNSGASLLVIDDLANRSYDCDLLLDATFGRDRLDYHGLVPADSNLLIGSLYALLRSEFAGQREAALIRRKSFEKVRRVLVSMGTTDIGGVTAKVVDEVLKAGPELALDVVIGASAESLDAVAKLAASDTRITLHVDTREIARLMRDSDLAVGAAGTTSWERCCLGLPAITLILAENQRPGAKALSEAGAVIALDHVDEIAPALRAVIKEPERISRMSAAAFAIVDGRGTQRVVSAIMGKRIAKAREIQLRSATAADADLLWLWRNDPFTRAGSRDTGAIPWRTHENWFTNALTDHDRKTLIAEEAAEPIGTVAFRKFQDGTEVSITVAPNARSRGVGKRILAAACEQVSDQLVAAVRKGNVPSQRLFESCGFEVSESREAGFARYVRTDNLRKRA